MSPLRAHESTFGGCVERRTTVPFEEADEDTAFPWAAWTCLAVMPAPWAGLPTSPQAWLSPSSPAAPHLHGGGSHVWLPSPLGVEVAANGPLQHPCCPVALSKVLTPGHRPRDHLPRLLTPVLLGFPGAVSLTGKDKSFLWPLHPGVGFRDSPRPPRRFRV